MALGQSCVGPAGMRRSHNPHVRESGAAAGRGTHPTRVLDMNLPEHLRTQMEADAIRVMQIEKYLYKARRKFCGTPPDLQRKSLRCTATASILIVAQCSRDPMTGRRHHGHGLQPVHPPV